MGLMNKIKHKADQATHGPPPIIHIPQLPDIFVENTHIPQPHIFEENTHIPIPHIPPIHIPVIPTPPPIKTLIPKIQPIPKPPPLKEIIHDIPIPKLPPMLDLNMSFLDIGGGGGKNKKAKEKHGTEAPNSEIPIEILAAVGVVGVLIITFTRFS